VGSGDPYKGRRKPWREGGFTLPPELHRARRRFHPAARARASQHAPPRARLRGNEGFWCFLAAGLIGLFWLSRAWPASGPRPQTRRLAAPRAQPSPWAALANAPQMTRSSSRSGSWKLRRLDLGVSNASLGKNLWQKHSTHGHKQRELLAVQQHIAESRRGVHACKRKKQN
jgi:hypothetical protein